MTIIPLIETNLALLSPIQIVSHQFANISENIVENVINCLHVYITIQEKAAHVWIIASLKNKNNVFNGIKIDRLKTCVYSLIITHSVIGKVLRRTHTLVRCFSRCTICRTKKKTNVCLWFLSVTFSPLSIHLQKSYYTFIVILFIIWHCCCCGCRAHTRLLQVYFNYGTWVKERSKAFPT